MACYRVDRIGTIYVNQYELVDCFDLILMKTTKLINFNSNVIMNASCT